MVGFNFNGLHSYDDFKILTTETPVIMMAKRKVNKITIPGRDGDLYDDEEAYENFTIPVKCAMQTLTKNELNDLIVEIKAWLSCGETDLIFDNQSDLAYKARVVNQIEFKNVLQTLGEFIILFECRPFSRLAAASKITVLTPTNIYNPSSSYSKPLIKVYGTGNITLKVGTQSVLLKNVSEYVTVDCELMDCYKDTLLKNHDMVGEFPRLEKGYNMVEGVGNVTKIEVTPNWRQL